MTGLIERIVRRTVAGAQCQQVASRRLTSQRLVSDMQEVDLRLEAAEQARLDAETARDRAIFELERLFHFVPTYLIFKNPEGILIRVNEFTAFGFGLKPEDMAGKSQREFWPSEQCDQFEADDKAILTTREGRYGYLEDVAWGGETHQFRTWKAPMYNGRPDPIGVMLCAIDVTIVGDATVECLGDFRDEV